MPLAKYELFIFDWDGTLSTSTSLVRVSRFFQRRYSVDYIKEHGKDYRAYNLNKAVHREEIGRMYSSLYDLYSRLSRPKLQPGSIELLKMLRKKGKRIAVFSDSNRYRLAAEMKMLGVLDYFDLVLTADSINKYKPNPDGILLIIKRFKVPKSRCIYTGDMAADVLTARFAKISVASVSNGVDSHALLKEIKPNYLFRNLLEFIKAF